MHCPGCGRVESGADRCGCHAVLEPPRFCPTCGRRLAVQVTPTGFTARCRDHGSIAPSTLDDADC